MTSRERWLAVLRRETPDRPPLDYWGTDEATDRLMAHLGCNTWPELAARLHIDYVVKAAPEYVGPTLKPGTDLYGCRFQNVDYGTGIYEECIYHPLAGLDTVAAIEASYTWPTADWFDFSGIADSLKGQETLPVRGGGSEPFLIYCDLRGREQAYMDLVLHPDLVHYCLDKLFDFAYEMSRRIYEQIPGQVMMARVAEDFGSQESLLFSPETIRTFFLPRMKRIIDLAHEAGAYVFFHSDGAVRPIIPDMIAAGIDILNPIQWRCPGMDRAELKRDFGDQVIFHGGVDNQYTLAFGTVDDVRAEVRDNMRLLGAGGGYILAPCHNVQAVSPPENIVAMYETACELAQVT